MSTPAEACPGCAALTAELGALRADRGRGRKPAEPRTEKGRLVAAARAATGLSNKGLALRLGVDPALLSPSRSFPAKGGAELVAALKLWIAGVQPKDDRWLHGYAAAVAAVYRLHHDAQMVVDVCSGDNIALGAFEEAGIESFDLEQIRLAFARR